MQKKQTPKHIAFIMDGNGRWATKRKLERNMGHKKGAEALIDVLKHCNKIGIKHVSIYAFSTENFKRSKKEVDGIFKYAEQFLDEYEHLFDENKIRLNVMGDYKRASKSLADKLERNIERTQGYNNGVLNLGLVYGGRAELVYAVNKFMKNNPDAKEITEQDISNNIYTAGQPDPDLIVRASGEQRLSNFMLWQCAYSEFYFPKTLWPDFCPKMVDKCVKEFSKRNRRMGGV